jgi:F-type H+-transporting ATPase subunit a
MTGYMDLSKLLFAAGGGHEGGHEGLSLFGLIVYVALVLGTIFVVLGRAKAGLKDRVFKNWFTGRFEQLYLFIENMCVNIIGGHGRQYVPIILSLWLVVFFSNLFSLFFPTSPTMDLSFNLALAFISIGYVQYEGIRANGFFGHFSHFAGPKLGPALIPITGMIFVIELISEVMKNVSLSVRIYGNIFGGHEATNAMNHLGEAALIPIGAFLLPVKLLTCVVQSLVFCLLTCVYLSLVTHHEDDHGDSAAHGKPAHA